MKKQTVVAITANTSWYLYNFRKNTILALISSGHDVIAIAPQDDFSEKLIELGASYHNIEIDQGGTNPLKDLKSLMDFFKLYFKFRPEIVLNFTPKNNIYSTLAASVFKTKIINNIAGLGEAFVDNNFVSRLVRGLYKVSQPKADIIFFQNKDDQVLFEKFKLAPTFKYKRIPGSGVDLTRFQIKVAPDDGCVRFLLIARMLHNKGVGYYVDAARKIKKSYGEKVEFRLLGPIGVNNPSAVTKEEMEIWSNEGVVNYLGISDQVEQEIAEVDCVVLPSFYREGVPKSLLEAAAMGKPIITTNNTGCRETVDDGINGYICEPKSTKSLVDKLQIVINQTHQRRIEMGLESRLKVEREFDEKIVIAQYLESVTRHHN